MRTKKSLPPTNIRAMAPVIATPAIRHILKIFLQRSNCRAPKFWLVNVTAAWENALVTK